MPDRRWHAEGNLSRRCQQAAPVDDFTGPRDPPGASLPRDHDAIAETIRRQAWRIMDVVLETERSGLHAHIDHQTREIARLAHLLEVARTERAHGTHQLEEQIRLLNTQLRAVTLECELLRVNRTRKEQEIETLKRKLATVDGERISLLQNITRRAHEVTSLNRTVAKSEREHAHLLESATRREQSTITNLDCDAQSPDHQRANHLMNAAPPLVGTRQPGITSRAAEPEGGARQVRETEYLKLILATANAERTRLQLSTTRQAREITALNRTLATLERERIRLQDQAAHREQTTTNVSRNLQALVYERERHMADAGRNAEHLTTRSPNPVDGQVDDTGQAVAYQQREVHVRIFAL